MFHCELLSGLWIGDTDILNNEKFIKDNNISIILNCTQMFGFPDIESLKKGLYLIEILCEDKIITKKLIK